MGNQIVEMLERVIGEHRPSLQPFDGKQLACRWRIALEADQPTEYGKQSYAGYMSMCVLNEY